MSYHINSTEEYHRLHLDSLGWELTLCNALYPEKSPCRRVLAENDSYGGLLWRFLSGYIPIQKIARIIEIGGGYGYLMHDFLRAQPGLSATMLDISHVLLDRQKQTLEGKRVEYIEDDFFRIDTAFFKNFEMAVLNEIMGDFPTACEVPSDIFGGLIQADDPILKNILRFHELYGLPKPAGPAFNFNLGAAEAVEKLCGSGVKYIFLSEHSCEARVPAEYIDLVQRAPSGMPERISLRGHSEYTIKFSHLERIARGLGYSAKRGLYADFIKFNLRPEVRFIFSSGATCKDEYEIIRQFIEDLFLYEYLILERNPC